MECGNTEPAGGNEVALSNLLETFARVIIVATSSAATGRLDRWVIEFGELLQYYTSDSLTSSFYLLLSS